LTLQYIEVDDASVSHDDVMDALRALCAASWSVDGAALAVRAHGDAEAQRRRAAEVLDLLGLSAPA
jgi:hypothetical protein